MPFSAMTVLNDQITATLDSSGTALPSSGVRYVDLQDAEFSRIHYDIVAVTGGATVAAQALGVILDVNGNPLQSQVFSQPGPSVGTAAQLVIGPWVPMPQNLQDAGDIQVMLNVVGTPNAQFTCYFADLQFR